MAQPQPQRLIIFLCLFAGAAQGTIFDCDSFNFDECVDSQNRPKIPCGQAGFCWPLQNCVWCSTTNSSSSCIPAPPCSNPDPMTTLQTTCPVGYVESKNTMDCGKQSQLQDILLSFVSLIPAVAYAYILFSDLFLRLSSFSGVFVVFVLALVAQHDLFAWGMLFFPTLVIPLVSYGYKKLMARQVNNPSVHQHLLDVNV